MKKSKKNSAPDSRFPVFPSMSALAGALGIDLAAVGRAKKRGLSGFGAAGRVSTAQLLAALLKNGTDDGKPERTLEHARARLADCKARQIEREAKLTDGELVDVLWVASELQNSFSDLGVYFGERIPRLAWDLVRAAHVGLDPSPTDEQSRRADTRIRDEISSEFRAIQGMIEARRKTMMDRLKKGPHPEHGGRTLLAELHEQVAKVCGGLSPGAKAEFAAALLKAQGQTAK